MEVEDAKLAGKLTEIKHDDLTYWIEDPSTGNGLCMVPNKSGKSVYYSRRRNWKSNWFPVRESQES